MKTFQSFVKLVIFSSGLGGGAYYKKFFFLGSCLCSPLMLSKIVSHIKWH